MIKVSKLLLVTFTIGALYGSNQVDVPEPKDPERLYNLSLMYRDGNGAQKSMTRAFLLCEQAAELGHPKAQCLLGDYYWKGMWVRKDKEKAVALYTTSAIASPNKQALCKLAYAYDYGKGVRQDRQIAFSLYEQAADQGSAMAHYNLGLMYEAGEGVEQNLLMGFYEMLDAAVLGDTDAQLFVAKQCEQKDPDVAIYWYECAAANGSEKATFRLGRLYERRKKDKQAFHWYARAVMMGDEEAKPYLARVSLKLKAREKNWRDGSLRPRRVNMKRPLNKRWKK